MTCLFCAIAAGERPAHVVLDEPDVVAFLDARPLFKGHVLLVPRTHVGTLVDIAAGALRRSSRRRSAWPPRWSRGSARRGRSWR